MVINRSKATRNWQDWPKILKTAPICSRILSDNLHKRNREWKHNRRLHKIIEHDNIGGRRSAIAHANTSRRPQSPQILQGRDILFGVQSCRSIPLHYSDGKIASTLSNPISHRLHAYGGQVRATHFSKLQPHGAPSARRVEYLSRQAGPDFPRGTHHQDTRL